MQKAEDLEVGSWVRNWNNCCVLLKYINVCLWEKEARAIKRWRFYAGSGNGWSSCIAGSLKKCLRKNHADFCCCSDILHTLYQKLDYHSFVSKVWSEGGLWLLKEMRQLPRIDYVDLIFWHLIAFSAIETQLLNEWGIKVKQLAWENVQVSGKTYHTYNSRLLPLLLMFCGV